MMRIKVILIRNKKMIRKKKFKIKILTMIFGEKVMERENNKMMKAKMDPIKNKMMKKYLLKKEDVDG